MIRRGHRVPSFKPLAAKAGDYLVIKIPCQVLSAAAAAAGSVRDRKLIPRLRHKQINKSIYCNKETTVH